MSEPGTLPDDFDLDQLRLTPEVSIPPAVSPQRPSQKAKLPSWKQRYPEGYIAAIPIAWLRHLLDASTVGFSGLYTALILWYRCRTTHMMVVTLPGSVIGRFGYARRNIQRGLKELEAAGLIQVDRRKGRLAQIWVLDERRSAENTQRDPS